jgi:hypothetical protein
MSFLGAIGRVMLAAGFSVTSLCLVGAQTSTLHTNLPHVIMAGQMQGNDCGARVVAADQALGSSPGIIQVSGECGSEFGMPVTLTEGHSIEFTHGGTYTVKAPIILGPSASLSGLPNASDDAPVRLVEAPGANLPYIVRMSGHSVLRDILLDGNGKQNPGGLDDILVQDANRVHILDVTARGAARDDLHVSSTGTSNRSGDGYLGPNVLLQHAGRDAMFIERSYDWIVGSQVEFESSGRDGLHGEDSAAFRCNGCDFGGNGRYGAASVTVNERGNTSCGWMIVGSQFGNNGQGDFYANGSASSIALNGLHTLTGNGFIQSHTTPNTYNSITLLDAGGNTISGNTWGFVQPTWASSFKYIVLTAFQRLPPNQRYRTTITGNNILPGTFGTAVFHLDGSDVTAGNVEGNGPSVMRNVVPGR